MDKKTYEKIYKCKNIEEIIQLAKDDGKDITREQAQHVLNIIRGNNTLSDTELNEISGGHCNAEEFYDLEEFNTPDKVKWVHNVGDYVEVFKSGINKKYAVTTYTAKIVELVVITEKKGGKEVYYDGYKVQKGNYNPEKIKRNSIQKN